MKFAEKERFFVDEYIESIVSTKSKKQEIEFSSVLSSLGAGDRLIISELSRMGRTLGVIIKPVDKILSQKIKLERNRKRQAGYTNENDGFNVRAIC